MPQTITNVAKLQCNQGIYEGKNYTYNEWKVKEQKLWEAYQQTKKKK